LKSYLETKYLPAWIIREYIENRGGKIVGAAVMAARKNSSALAVKAEMSAAIAQKHGS